MTPPTPLPETDRSPPDGNLPDMSSRPSLVRAKAHLQCMSRGSLMRFILIGGSSAALSISLLYIAVDLLGIPYLLAFAAIFVGINTTAYLASRRMVFPSTRVGLHSGLLRYFAVTSISLTINSLALILLVEIAGIAPVPANMILSLANAPMNYFLHKRVTFRIRHPGQTGKI